MKQKQKNYLAYMLAFAGVITIFSLGLEQKWVAGTKAQEEFPNTVMIAEHPKVSKEDRKPLPVPSEALKKGHTLKLPILMYHHVGVVPYLGAGDSVRRGLTVTPENFEQQLSWLRSQGYSSVSLDDLYHFSLNKKPLPQKPVIFSFDDGYDDVFINAIPILKKYGFTGSFGIITSWPGWVNGTNTYATWQQIVKAKDQGMEIVCHTQNHFDGTSKKFDAAFIYKNLSGCQKDLADHLGSAQPYLIYPYGHYSPTYIEQAKKVGFVMGLTVHEGSLINLESLMEIPRVRVGSAESLDTFIKWLTE